MSYISAVTKENDVVVWERNSDGNRIEQHYPAPFYYYADDKSGKFKTIYGTKVTKKEFKSQREMRKSAQADIGAGLKVWESDIPAEMRVLSNLYFGVEAPKLHVTFYDIEVDYDPEIGFSTIENPYAPINSVALLHTWSKEFVVIVVPPEEGWNEDRLAKEVANAAPDAPISDEFKTRYIICRDEKELLMNLIIEFEDSDVVSGWNSDFFDMPYVTQRIARVLDGEALNLATNITEGYNGKPKLAYEENPNVIIAKPNKCKWVKRLDFPHYGMPSFSAVTTQQGKLMGHKVELVGRIHFDYLVLFKKYEQGERQSYKLASVSDLVLVDDKTKQPLLPKLEYEGSLADLYRKDFAFFVRYNIRDTEILHGFEKKLGYVELANQMYHLSTGLAPHVTGTLKLAELALVNYCHHVKKLVVNNMQEPEIDRQIDGALVLLPQIGLHERYGSIDINSLYPSAIRSINISPEMIRGQFIGCFEDAKEIAVCSYNRLTFKFESDGHEETHSAEQWRDYFIENCWAISGYGTAFCQKKQGFIPALLEEWYATRKKYQKMKADAAKAGNYQLEGYYDRLQYVYKIKLNSLYGALTNLYFRFYDLRMGESTTGTGRVILKHQCRKTCETLEGNYDVDFPLYPTLETAIEMGYTEAEAKMIALDGPIFNGKFQSDSVIYGDTDSTYFKTYTDTNEEAIAIADAVAAKVNASYPEFMRRTFLCRPGFDNIIKAGREIVSDRGIFVEKKRYILHLIDLDGKSVDKMKVMGLDTKKTNLPAEVSVHLNKFIERFLKGETWESISQSIVDYKETLFNTKDITIIGLPGGVKNVEEYTQRYLEEGKSAKLPGRAAAAIHYNCCLKEFNDKVSMPIMDSMKVKVFYLVGDHGKFKSIALPTDLEVVPSWFIEKFRVDKEAHIQRLVDNPLTNILKAIGKEPPSKQSLLVDSLLVF